MSDAFPFLYNCIWKGGDIYDKKRIFSIYYNITPILGCNFITSKIAKASDFNGC